MKRKLSKFTQNYPTERKDYPSSERARAIERENRETEDDGTHGLVSIEEAVRIESYDLPSSSEPSEAPLPGEDDDHEAA